MRQLLVMALLSLKRSFLDHNPILLKLVQAIYYGPKPFRCYDARFSHSRFLRLLGKERRNLPEVLLNDKLKALEKPIIQ